MLNAYIENGGKSETIKFYYEHGGLTKEHFNQGVFETDEQFEEEYINVYGERDFINQYIIYC